MVTSLAPDPAINRRMLRYVRLMLMPRGLRDAEAAQILVCALLGGLVGAVVALLREAVGWLHVADFGIPGGRYLSEGFGISPLRLLCVPLLGGLALGLAARAARSRRLAEIVDPIEANALHGGRMSLRQSLWLTFTTILSNGAGASLGMEAGYSQLGAGFYSWVGAKFRLRRADLRVFVTAGAGAAIAAAFNAPLAGAFYGFELILGSYTTSALAPVIVAAVCAALVERNLSHLKDLFEVTGGISVTSESYFLFALLGILSAGVSVLAMQAATWCERTLRATRLPDWLRPAAGGLALSVIAFAAPQVLGSGHGAVQFHFETRWTIAALVFLLAAKLAASAVSLGSGFRGGLFSSALFLGALLGAAFGQAAAAWQPAFDAEHNAFMLAGMGAVAAGIIGAPLTMVFLVLEATGDFAVTIAVVIAVTVSATLVRIAFGYSFATWRFHLRGLTIWGAHDVGWISDMTVGRLMSRDVKCVPAGMGLGSLRAAFPPGSAKRIYVAGAGDAYVGMIEVDDLHDRAIDDALDGAVAADLASEAGNYLLPDENIRTALARFETLRVESLPVLASASQRHVIGVLTEAYTLKRYAQELERIRNAELGRPDLFALGPLPPRREGRN